MGWLSWERFRCNVDCKSDPKNCISESLMREISDRLVKDGFAEAGYSVVGIDDCWLASSRDATGRLQPDSKRFPSGMAQLANYIHQRGLKFGLYEDIGSRTCGGYPGMAGSLELDAQTFAEWGVDYIKVDGCYADAKEYENLYPLLERYLNKTGRPITYSCSWPAYLPDPVQTSFKVPYAALKNSCNLWRNWVDIQDSWSSLAAIINFWAEASQKSDGFQEVAGAGAWNDPDMLIIGNKGLTEEQSRVQMGMWAIFAAPLLMSNDLRDLNPAARDILLNKQAIAINQDPLGIQGRLLSCPSGCKKTQLWYRQLHDNARAIAFLNLSEEALEQPLCISWSSISWEAAGEVKVARVFDTAKEEELKVSKHGLCLEKMQPTSILFLRAEMHSMQLVTA